MGRRPHPPGDKHALFTALVQALLAAIGAELRGDPHARALHAGEAHRIWSELDRRWPGWRAWASRSMRREW